jgi:3-phosphoglycerate kinase
MGPSKLQASGVGKVLPRRLTRLLEQEVGMIGSYQSQRPSEAKLFAGGSKVPASFCPRLMLDLVNFLAVRIGDKF